MLIRGHTCLSQAEKKPLLGQWNISAQKTLRPAPDATVDLNMEAPPSAPEIRMSQDLGVT